MIDKLLLKKRFEKSLKTYDENAIIQNYMGEKLINLLPEKVFNKIFEFGVGTGNLTRLISEKFSYEELFLNDIVEKSETWVQKHVADFNFIKGDIEKIELPRNIDLIISNATVQWLKDFDKLLEKVSKSIDKAGIFAFSTFGEDNFLEIERIFGIGLKYLSKETIEEKVQKHFKILHLKDDRIEVDFSTPTAVLKHIKNTGVNSIGPKTFYKSTLKKFNLDYNRLFSSQDGVKLTYHPIFVVLEKL